MDAQNKPMVAPFVGFNHSQTQHDMKTSPPPASSMDWRSVRKDRNISTSNDGIASDTMKGD